MAGTTKKTSATIIHALGDAAVTIEFGDAIDPAINARVMTARSAIERAGIRGVVETVPTFRALAVHFDPARIGQDALIAAIREVDLSKPDVRAAGRTWHVPVLYDGPDLDEMARHAGVTADEAARMHAAPNYQVYMLGFLPGFAYLGDLPEPLRLPRLKEPRTRVPPGSVAIADQLTAVYPVESPGGWRLIGRTPLRLFDHRANPPSLFQAGDTVTFAPIDRAEFERQVRAQEQIA